jgi:hypothetical protein
MASPTERVLKITLAMARLHEYVAMGRFVPHLDDETLTACLERLSDEDLLRVAFVFEASRRSSAHARGAAERGRSRIER